jgi:lactate permease
VIFAGVTGRTPEEVGGYFARFMPVITTLIALGMLWIVGRWKMVLRGIVPAVLTGLVAGFIAIGMNAAGLVTLTGVAAGAGVALVIGLYLRLRGRPVFDRAGLGPGDVAAESAMSLFRALSPWIVLVVLCLVTNEPWLGIRKSLFNRLAMPLTIVPGKPESLRLFWQAYFWILVSTLLSLPLLRASSRQVKETLALWLRRAPRPVLSAAVFFAIAYVINHSGKTGAVGPNGQWLLPEGNVNMVALLATASASFFRQAYVAVAPYLGLLAGFISGSEGSAIAMLTQLHLTTAGKILANGYIIAAASAVGGGLASVISPAKLQNAAAAIDRIGAETEVIKTAMVIAIVIVLAVAGLAFIWS